jgi:hypothetical protein
MIALVILGHEFDGVSLIAGALAAYVVSIALLIVFVWLALKLQECRDIYEGLEKGTYTHGDPGPKFGRDE